MTRQIQRTPGSGGIRFLAVLIAAICVVFVLSGAPARAEVGAEKVAPSVLQSITAGLPQDVIVLFDDASIRNEAETMRWNIGASHDTPAIIEKKRAGYKALKQGILGLLPAGEHEVLKDYSHLPMVFMRVKSQNALADNLLLNAS